MNYGSIVIIALWGQEPFISCPVSLVFSISDVSLLSSEDIWYLLNECRVVLKLLLSVENLTCWWWWHCLCWRKEGGRALGTQH